MRLLRSLAPCLALVSVSVCLIFVAGCSKESKLSGDVEGVKKDAAITSVLHVKDAKTNNHQIWLYLNCPNVVCDPSFKSAPFLSALRKQCPEAEALLFRINYPAGQTPPELSAGTYKGLLDAVPGADGGKLGATYYTQQKDVILYDVALNLSSASPVAGTFDVKYTKANLTGAFSGPVTVCQK